ncbi:DNA cross-link repair 1A protein [Dissostichus eleginoides]|uniref:DNA cross-link repair 1A protein n=1 Tax=Dissostichus eleginoides TaxID=100907 RepID=A0AAD9BGV9_DISEL|nr:DNA cross-link repair 1A protein [Dissostichus eleginoides]
MCQMPFSILVVQTQRWHVAECLDTPRDTCKECPDGLQCCSTIPNHYKKCNHTSWPNVEQTVTQPSSVCPNRRGPAGGRASAVSQG